MNVIQSLNLYHSVIFTGTDSVKMMITKLTIEAIGLSGPKGENDVITGVIRKKIGIKNESTVITEQKEVTTETIEETEVTTETIEETEVTTETTEEIELTTETIEEIEVTTEKIEEIELTTETIEEIEEGEVTLRQEIGPIDQIGHSPQMVTRGRKGALSRKIVENVDRPSRNSTKCNARNYQIHCH